MQIVQLGHIVKELLQRHSMVILPGLGGLVRERVSARLDAPRGRLTPPTEAIWFNTQLKHNDGLLIHAVATTRGIGLNQADDQVTDALNELRFLLAKGETIELPEVGSLKNTVEGHIHFVHDAAGISAMASFGLKTLQLTETHQKKDVRVVVLQTVKALPVKRIVGYAAAAMLAGVMIWLPFQEGFVSNGKQLVAEMGLVPTRAERVYTPRTFAPIWENEITSEPNLEVMLEEATAAVDNLSFVEAGVPQLFRVIAAIMTDRSAAEAYASKLQSRGFAAEYVGVASGGQHLVAYGSYGSKSDAEAMLASVSMSNKDAFLYVEQ